MESNYLEPHETCTVKDFYALMIYLLLSGDATTKWLNKFPRTAIKYSQMGTRSPTLACNIVLCQDVFYGTTWWNSLMILKSGTCKGL